VVVNDLSAQIAGADGKVAMQIQSSNISFVSSYQSMVRDQSSERLRTWSGSAPVANLDRQDESSSARSPVSISAAARSALAADLKAATEAFQAQASDQSGTATAIDNAFEAAGNDPVMGLIKSMIEMMTGEAIKLFSADDRRSSQGQLSPPALPSGAMSSADGAAAGSGLEYDYHSLHEEFQQMNFSAEGHIKTADGQEISFSIDLSMSRYYREETSVNVRAGDAARQDPLVLNFDGPAAQLSDRSFSFDVFGNGRKASLPLLQGNRGYLAIDRHGNGKIDSGKELFGPRTNSGFKELAGLDDVGNGWLDENDSAFDSLRLWSPDEKGAGTLQGLKQGQVGAIQDVDLTV